MAKTGSKRMPIGKVDQVALTKAMQEIPQLMQDNPGSTFHKACGNIAAQFNISISSVTSRYGIMVINGKVPTVQMQACRTPNPDRKKFFRLLRAILQDETIEERNKILESQFGVDNIAKLCEKLAEYSLDSEKADSITSQYYRIKQESVKKASDVSPKNVKWMEKYWNSLSNTEASSASIASTSVASTSAASAYVTNNLNDKESGTSVNQLNIGSRKLSILDVNQVALNKAMQEIPQLMQDNPDLSFNKACENIAEQFNIPSNAVRARCLAMVTEGKVAPVKMRSYRPQCPDRKKFFRLLRAILQDKTIEERKKILKSQFGVDSVAKLCEKLAEYSLDSEKADSITSQYYRIKQESVKKASDVSPKNVKWMEKYWNSLSNTEASSASIASTSVASASAASASAASASVTSASVASNINAVNQGYSRQKRKQKNPQKLNAKELNKNHSADESDIDSETWEIELKTGESKPKIARTEPSANQTNDQPPQQHPLDLTIHNKDDNKDDNKVPTNLTSSRASGDSGILRLF